MYRATAGHVAYVGDLPGAGPVVFCGDTLFASGCGRLFEGTPAQMLASLDKLAALPGDTRVYCAHEVRAQQRPLCPGRGAGQPGPGGVVGAGGYPARGRYAYGANHRGARARGQSVPAVREPPSARLCGRRAAT
jgi:glyoxylase-like metal-dependent hydrolase (beta-lactamase superfamily II)